MSTPIQTDLDSFLANRRKELLADTTKSGSSSRATLTTQQVDEDAVVATTEPPEDINFFQGLLGSNPAMAPLAKYLDTVINTQRRVTPAERDAQIRQLDQYAEEDVNVMSILGITPGSVPAGAARRLENFGRKGIQSRVAGEQLAGKLDEVSNFANTTIDEGSNAIRALGSKLWSKEGLATKTPDEFNRILNTVPEENLPQFFEGMGIKLIQSIRDMPRLTQTAQRNLLSPSGRNALKHTLQGLPDEEFKALITMIEKGLWQEARNKVLKWGVLLPVIGYLSRDLVGDFLRGGR